MNLFQNYCFVVSIVLIELNRQINMAKNEENWLLHYTELKEHIMEHHRLPPKNAPLGAKYLLNWSKYVRRTIKEGTCDEWKREMFESLMAERHLDEHTGGRKKRESNH